MCPAMGWLDCGQRFHCPFCGKLTEGKLEKGEFKGETKKLEPKSPLFFFFILRTLLK